MVLMNLFVPAESEEDEDRRKKIWGQIFRQSSVADRIRWERVDRFWGETVRAEGWTEQRKLDAKIVFGEGHRLRLSKFNAESLVFLFHRCGPNLKELDLSSFKPRLLPEVGEELAAGAIALISQHLPGSLTSVNLTAFPGTAFLGAFPEALLELQINICNESLSMLVGRFPLLQKVRFYHRGTHGLDLPLNLMNEFLANHVSLRKFELDGQLFRWTAENDGLPALEHLPGLEELLLGDLYAQRPTFRAIVRGRFFNTLRRLHLVLDTNPQYTRQELHALGRFHALEELRLFAPEFDDEGLKAIAVHGKLKKLDVNRCPSITDEGVEFTVANCERLVTLDVSQCPHVGERSLRAVVAEVQRRHAGDPPGRQATSSTDPEIFCLGITGARAVIAQIIAPVRGWLVAEAEIDGALYHRPV